MKTLTIGSTTLELKDFRKIRNAVVGVYAEIVIPTSAIARDDLNALFKDNQHDLIVTEEDGSTTTYSGYNKWDETKEKADYYTVIQICESEAIHLLNEARKQIKTLEQEKKELQNVVNAQGNEIIAQAETIVLQGETIAVQNEQVAALMEASASQLGAIDSIMTEVIPLVAQEAATIAVEQALAAIAENETENPVDETEEETETTEEE